MSKFQYMHFRPTGTKSQGGATVAIYPVESNKVLISIALCARDDVFNRKIGRDVSSGRIRAALAERVGTLGKVREIEVADMTNMKETVAAKLVMEMAEHGLA